jgi:hypothetical protein
MKVIKEPINSTESIRIHEKQVDSSKPYTTAPLKS